MPPAIPKPTCPECGFAGVRTPAECPVCRYARRDGDDARDPGWGSQTMKAVGIIGLLASPLAFLDSFSSGLAAVFGGVILIWTGAVYESLEAIAAELRRRK